MIDDCYDDGEYYRINYYSARERERERSGNDPIVRKFALRYGAVGDNLQMMKPQQWQPCGTETKDEKE